MQVMATVAVHKFLSSNVADFKIKYPDWNKSVPTLLKKIKKKRRLRNIATKDDKEDIKALNKESKASKIKSDTELLENEEEKDSEGVSELSGEESERSTNNEHDENVQSSESEIDEKEDSHNESSEEKSDLDENHQRVKSKSNKNIKNIHSKNENKPSIKNVASDKDCKIPSTRKNVELSKENKTIIQKVVDPFFMTSTNEEYVSSQVPSAVDDHSNWRSRNTSFEYREHKSFDKNNRKWGAKEINSKHNKFSKFNNQPYKKPTFNHFDKGPLHNNFKTTNKLIIGNRKARRSALHHPVQEEKLEKLHPSWEAKKKLSSLASFKGKKTTFD